MPPLTTSAPTIDWSKAKPSEFLSEEGNISGLLRDACYIRRCLELLTPKRIEESDLPISLKIRLYAARKAVGLQDGLPREDLETELTLIARGRAEFDKRCPSLSEGVKPQ